MLVVVRDKRSCASRLTLLLQRVEGIPKQHHDIRIRCVCVYDLPHDSYPGSLLTSTPCQAGADNSHVQSSFTPQTPL